MLTAVDILGIRVQSGPVRHVIEHIDCRMLEGEATRVAFLNAHLSNVCSSNRELGEHLGRFLVLNDGVGLNLARRVLYGQPFSENLNGTDFVSAYLDGTAYDLRVFLLGAHIDVIDRTARIFAERWPRHSVVGFHHGFTQEADAGALRGMIAATRPDLILVGMGNPRQEKWIAEHVPGLCGCAMAVGAWFDFIAEAVPRAPSIIRRAHLEWVFRLCIEPRRLARRYLVGNVVFLARLGLTRLRGGRLREA